RIVIRACLDDRARRGIAGEFQIPEPKVMGAAIDAGDDHVGGSLELVVEGTLDESAQHRVGRLLPVQREAADVWLGAGAAHRLMHGLDDVAAHAELAQRPVESRFQNPASCAHRVGEAEAFQLGGAAKQQAAELRVLGVWAGPEIDDATAFVRDVAQRAIEAGPTLRLDLPLQRALNLLFGARTQLEGDPLRGPVADAATDVVAADDQVRAVVGAAADQKMDMGIVRVPVIDGDPVEPRAEIALHIGDELAREGLEVADLRRVLRRDNEAEVVAVVLAAFREAALVGVIAGRIEHPRRCSVTGDAVALEIGDVLGQRRRAEPRALVTDDARFGHDAPRVRAQPDRDRGAAPTAEARPAPALAGPEAVADVPRLLRGPHHLADEGLRTLAAAVAMLDAPRPDAQVVVPCRHGRNPGRVAVRRRSGR